MPHTAAVVSDQSDARPARGPQHLHGIGRIR